MPATYPSRTDRARWSGSGSSAARRIACDALMNSLLLTPERVSGRGGVSYTERIMTQQSALGVRPVSGQESGSSLGQSRLAMSEVQICGIPKLSSLEVAPTP